MKNKDNIINAMIKASLNSVLKKIFLTNVIIIKLEK